MPIQRVLLRSGAVVVGAGGLVVAVVWVFLSMRTVMDIGGSCASGGPYVTATPCPSGADLMAGAILGGFACFFLYATVGLPGPRLALLTWPALFLSLGWNFIAYARHPAVAGSPTASWWFCGVMFWVMGGLPLIVGLASPTRRRLLWSAGFEPTGGMFAGRVRGSSKPAAAPPRDIDELLAAALPRQEWGAGYSPAAPEAPPRWSQLRTTQVYSVILHIAVLAAAGWLSVAAFDRLTS
jgi:hypothetical protein